MAVSVTARPAPAKAMAVSDSQAAWPTGPGSGARGRRGLAGLRDDAPNYTSATRHHRCGGRRRDWWTWLRRPWAAAGPGRASRRRAKLHVSNQAPQVWRAPEGPEGTGGLRGAAPNEVRPPSLAGGRARRRPEHPWGTKPHAPRGHTKTPTRNRVGVSEPPVGIEPTTYSLRVNRSAD